MIAMSGAAETGIQPKDHVGLVYHWANYYTAKNIPRLEYGDFVLWGYGGLLKAIKKYNPKRGAFSTCASLYIRSEIQKGMRANARNLAITYVTVSDEDRIDKTPQSRNAENEECAAALENLLNELPPDERFVLYSLYYLQWTQRETAKCLQVTHTRVQQLRDKALMKTRLLAQGTRYRSLNQFL